MSVCDDLHVPRELAMFSTECHKSSEKSGMGLRDMTPRIEATRVVRDGESFSD